MFISPSSRISLTISRRATDNNAMTGNIPEEIANLKSLKKLSFCEYSRLFSWVDDEGNINLLFHFSLSFRFSLNNFAAGNALSGTFPWEILLLTQMTELNVGTTLLLLVIRAYRFISIA